MSWLAFFFFFSSRRRHTRLVSDWSSDVALPIFVNTRVFDAPRSDVFKAETDPERMEQWWGPNGLTMPYCKIDLRPGGIMHFCMRAPDGQDKIGRASCRERG